MEKELTLDEINSLPDKEWDIEEIESLPEERPFYDVTGKGLLKGAIESLPIAGGLIGTIGGFPGIAVGSASGKALENIAEKYLLDEEKTRPDIYAGPIAEAASAVTGEVAAPAIGRGLSKIVSGIGAGLKKTVSSAATIPEKVIETYMNRPDAVKSIGQLSESTSIQDASDRLRQEAVAAIEDFSKINNEDISFILMEKGDRPVNVSRLKQIGNNIIKKLDPKINADLVEIGKIKEQINQIEKLQSSHDNTFIPASKVHRLKQILQDAADYDSNGLIKQKKGIADSTFKAMASEAKQLVESVAPEIRNVNQNLQKMHNIKKKINRNLINTEVTAASVMGVGSGQNQQAIKQMKKLEDLIGFPYVKEAENIVAAQYFNNAPLLPQVMTGRGAIPVIAGIPHALNQLSQGNLASAAAGVGVASLGSPLAIKGGINLGIMGKKAGKYLQEASPLGSAEMVEQLMNRALQMGVSPYAIDGMIKNSEQLTTTMKAQLRNKNAKAVK